MIYQFRDGFHVKGDPQQVGDTLDALRAGGRLTPAQVVAAAAESGSPLHDHFEWDDSEAARKYRLGQAAYLIRAIVLCPDGHERPHEPVRAFVRVDEAGPGGGTSFAHICDAMRDNELREQVVERARCELVAWRHRYANLNDFAALFETIDALV